MLVYVARAKNATAEDFARSRLPELHRSPLQAEAYLATHESQNFGGDTPKKGTTPNLKFQN